MLCILWIYGENMLPVSADNNGMVFLSLCVNASPLSVETILKNQPLYHTKMPGNHNDLYSFLLILFSVEDNQEFKNQFLIF